MKEEIEQQRRNFDELKFRIENEIKHRGGNLNSGVNAAWRGYLAAALEWGVINPSQHDKLNELLPSLVDNPAMNIFTGYADE